MKIKRPEIILDGIQIKSLNKAKKLAKLLNELEIEFGIYETRITIRDPFICPDIDLSKLEEGMEKTLKNILIIIRKKQYGEINPSSKGKAGSD
jgi:hypothetical protein